jgi:hypothetical protein
VTSVKQASYYLRESGLAAFTGEERYSVRGIAFNGEGKLVRKATGYEQEKAEAALSHTGFAGCASRASGAPLGAYR